MKLTFEEYLKYFDVGVKDYVIAAVHGISPSTLKNYKRSWGFTPQAAEQRKVEIYKKWHSLGYADKEIAKLMGMSYCGLYELKARNGLTKEHGWNTRLKGKGTIAYGLRTIY